MTVLLTLTSFSIFYLFLFKSCTFHSSKTSFTSPDHLPEKKERPGYHKTKETPLKSVSMDEITSSKNESDVILKDSLLNEITSPPLKYYSGKN